MDNECLDYYLEKVTPQYFGEGPITNNNVEKYIFHANKRGLKMNIKKINITGMTDKQMQ